MKKQKSHPKRRMISEQVSTIDVENTLKSLREEIDKLIWYYGEDARVEQTSNYDGYEYGVFREREETDEELAKRVEAETLYRKLLEDREYAEYYRLSEKFATNQK